MPDREIERDREFREANKERYRAKKWESLTRREKEFDKRKRLQREIDAIKWSKTP